MLDSKTESSFLSTSQLNDSEDDLFVEFLSYFGFDKEHSLLYWIYEEISNSSLPLLWSEAFADAEDRPYYYYPGSSSTWSHPVDQFFRIWAKNHLKPALSQSPSLARSFTLHPPAVILDILNMAVFYSINCVTNPSGMWLPMLALIAPLPQGWSFRDDIATYVHIDGRASPRHPRDHELQMWAEEHAGANPESLTKAVSDKDPADSPADSPADLWIVPGLLPEERARLPPGRILVYSFSAGARAVAPSEAASYPRLVPPEGFMPPGLERHIKYLNEHDHYRADPDAVPAEVSEQLEQPVPGQDEGEISPVKPKRKKRRRRKLQPRPHVASPSDIIIDEACPTPPDICEFYGRQVIPGQTTRSLLVKLKKRRNRWVLSSTLDGEPVRIQTAAMEFGPPCPADFHVGTPIHVHGESIPLLINGADAHTLHWIYEGGSRMSEAIRRLHHELSKHPTSKSRPPPLLPESEVLLAGKASPRAMADTTSLLLEEVRRIRPGFKLKTVLKSRTLKFMM